MTPFTITEPEGDESPVLVEVPHAGLAVDAEALDWMVVPAASIARDADLYADELFRNAPEHGATLLVAHASRYLVDLNRAEDTYDAQAVQGGQRERHPRGVIWHLSSRGLPVLRSPLSPEEYERRMESYYRPYHRALRDILTRKRQRFGFAVLLCAHSMPPQRTRGQDGALMVEADIVPGTRGRTSADATWIDLVDQVSRAQGWLVQHDVPYRGGFSTGHYGRPADGIHAIQLELARRLYLDDKSLARQPGGFERTNRFANELVSALVQHAAQVCRPEAG